MKCTKCNNEATYDTPEDLCDGCWFDWWAEGWKNDITQEEYDRLKQEHIDSFKDIPNTEWKDLNDPQVEKLIESIK